MAKQQLVNLNFKVEPFYKELLEEAKWTLRKSQTDVVKEAIVLYCREHGVTFPEEETTQTVS